MSAYLNIRIARAGTFPDRAGDYLYKHGPTAERELFAAVVPTLTAQRRVEALQRAVLSGWLTTTSGGIVDCSAAARDHYDQLEGKAIPKPIGDVAAPRQAINAFERPTLSTKYMPNSRGTRQDIPAWSVRPPGVGFKSVGGSEARPMRFPGKEGQ